MFELEHLKFKDILDIKALKITRPVSCIVGASGSGKTTLLRMFNRMNVPDEGIVYYEGRDIENWDAVKLRREVVMLGQNPIIYSGSVEDNLQIGRMYSEKPLATKEALREIMERVELDKPLADGCRNFSGGEKQRLCLARVMLMDAPVYLLDEPSAALDAQTEKFIIDNFIDFVQRKKKQLIMITHSERLADSLEDSIIRLDKGRVTEAYDE